ncbi:MAG: LytR C-terminal domain-containing protein [Propionibacteriaceae bacterium]|jgi:hypothetical protein|nr:LytR C-terminal domain-containing protein [Propionibacteriaceae bacterium]
MDKVRKYAAPVVLLLMLALFLMGALWGYKAMTSPFGMASTPPPTCMSQSADDVTPDMVTLNVYNVDTKSGHAREVADMLTTIGFVVAVISNASYPVSGQAVIVGSAVDAPEVVLTAGFFTNILVVADNRADHSVDVYISNALETLNPDAPTSVDVQDDSICLPSIAPHSPSVSPTTPATETTEPESQE